MSVSQIIKKQLETDALSLKKNLRNQVDSIEKSLLWVYREIDSKLEEAIFIEKLPWTPQRNKKLSFLSKQIDELKTRMCLDFKTLNALEKKVEKI